MLTIGRQGDRGQWVELIMTPDVAEEIARLIDQAHGSRSTTARADAGAIKYVAKSAARYAEGN